MIELVFFLAAGLFSALIYALACVWQGRIDAQTEQALMSYLVDKGLEVANPSPDEITYHINSPPQEITLRAISPCLSFVLDGHPVYFFNRRYGRAFHPTLLTVEDHVTHPVEEVDIYELYYKANSEAARSESPLEESPSIATLTQWAIEYAKVGQVLPIWKATITRQGAIVLTGRAYPRNVSQYIEVVDAGRTLLRRLRYAA